MCFRTRALVHKGATACTSALVSAGRAGLRSNTQHTVLACSALVPPGRCFRGPELRPAGSSTVMTHLPAVGTRACRGGRGCMAGAPGGRSAAQVSKAAEAEVVEAAAGACPRSRAVARKRLAVTAPAGSPAVHPAHLPQPVAPSTVPAACPWKVCGV